MGNVLKCRRTITALFGITCLTAIALVKGLDTSTAIASVAIGLAAANATEKTLKKGGLAAAAGTEGANGQTAQ